MQRLLGGFLSFLLIFSAVITGLAPQASAAEKELKIQNVNLKRLVEKEDTIAKEEAELFAPDEKVRVVVEVEGEPAIEEATKQNKKFTALKESVRQQLEKKLLTEQEKVKDEIADEGVQIEYINEFTTVFNGFSGEVKFGDIEKIEKLDKVKNVYIATEYKRPEVKPDMKYSKELVEAQKAWKASGFKGEGMVVGIIDSGIDYNHKDMVLTDINADEGYLTKEEVNQAIAEHDLPGKFYTEKVPYGYNYFDKTDEVRDLGAGASMHGQHVAGTVGANGDEENGGLAGVAPEAQLLALKVFGNDPNFGSTFGDVYIKAIDDAIKLGADVVNMSLGAASGFVDSTNPEQEAVNRAVENGVLMSISAGNAKHFGHGFYGNDLLFASNPDYGVVGTPGISYDSIQVAGFENSHIELEALEYSIDGEAGIKAAFLSASDVHPNDIEQKTFDVVYGGLGKVEELEGLDLEGKYVLIQRGELAFVDKTLNAQAAGASGVIIYNNEDGIVNMASDPSIKIPQLFMLKVDGDKLAEALQNGSEVSISFNGGSITLANPFAGEMYDFSSWGLTPDLEFKPEITAPGANILSTLNDDQYGVMSGTSMAAPHVAGGAALVLERVDKEFGVTGADRVNLAERFLQNTAAIIEDSEGDPISPRHQGAGIMQINAALNTPVTVVDSKTKEPEVALKEVTANSVSFELIATNYSDEAVTYEVSGSVLTDVPVDAGVYAVSPNLFGALDLVELGFATLTVNGEKTKSVEIPAKSTANLNVKITINSEANNALNSIFTNGYWLDGFVTLVDPTDTYPTLSVPYAGFKGEWDAAPIFDAPRWDENSFYGFTDVVSSIEDGLYFIGNSYFSPNGDGVLDEAIPLVSFLRNAKEVTVKVLDENQKELRTIRTDYEVTKNFFDGGERNPYTLNFGWTWDGTVKGEVVEDGQYYIQLEGVIDFKGAKKQTLLLPVGVDTTKPVIDDVRYDAELNTVYATVTDEESGVMLWDILIDGESVTGDEGFSGEVTEHTFEQPIADTETITIVAVDNAGNEAFAYVQAEEDNLAPDIFSVAPEYFAIYNQSKIEVYGQVKDQSEVVSVTVNNVEAELTYHADENVYSYHAVLELDDNLHDILIKAVDTSGNEAQIRRPVFVDTTPPEITVNVPETVGTDVETVDVSVHVKDNFDDIRIYVDDSEVYAKDLSTPYGMKGFDETIEGITLELPDVETTFEFKVVDIAGNETVEEVKVLKTDEPGEDPEEPGDEDQPGDEAEEPGDEEQPGDETEEPGDEEQPGDEAEDPGDEEQPGDEAEDPGDKEQPGDEAEDPGDEEQPGDEAEDPGDKEQPGDEAEEPGDEKQPGDETEVPSDEEQLGDENEPFSVQAEVGEDGVVVLGDDFNQALAEAEEGQPIVVDLNDATAGTLKLTEEQINQLMEKNIPLVVKNDEVSAQIPASLFNGANEVEFKFEKLENVDLPENALGLVYEYNLYVDGKEVTEFGNHPITLSFNVDPTKVENADILNVYYLDEDEQAWVLIEGGVYNNGILTVDTTHFTIFTVIESDEEKIVVGKLDDSTKKPDAKGEDSTGKSKGGKGGKLPSTATTVYNMLGAGLGFLVVSIFLGVYVYIRKRSQFIKE